MPDPEANISARDSESMQLMARPGLVRSIVELMAAPAGIASLFETGAQAWPGVQVDPGAYAAHVAQIGATEVDPLGAVDLYLAFACACRSAQALAVFEEQRFQEVYRALARLRLTDAQAEEIAQRVRTKVLVGDGTSPPRIVAYRGKGSLVGWLRAIAVHEALSVKRAEKRRGPEDGVSAIERLASPEEPELARLRERYAAPFKEAFAAALGTLATRDRNVLRLVYLEGLTAEQVGLAYGVHRVSVARWLGQIRESLFVRTRQILGERLNLGASEFESVTRLCLSQMDVSLERLLVEMDSRPR